MEHYFTVAFGEAEKAHQRRHNSEERLSVAASGSAPHGLGQAEVNFLAGRDSFYLSTVGANGWPYVQHRGGPAGFITVVDPWHIAWAERSGNRQYVTAGHLDTDDRVALIAVDYPSHSRLKLFGRARYDTNPSPMLLNQLGIGGSLDALVTVEVVAFDWNCPKFITPRFTVEQVRAITAPLQQRITELEHALARSTTEPTSLR